MFTSNYSIEHSSCFLFCSVLFHTSSLHFPNFIKINPKYLNAIKPLISVPSATLIFIYVVTVITFLPQFGKFHSYRFVSIPFSALCHSFSVCLRYLISYIKKRSILFVNSANLVAILREIHRKFDRLIDLRRL